MFAIVCILMFSLRPNFARAADVRVPDVEVTGERSVPGDVAPASTELSGARLAQRRRATIGETLRQEVGVTSSDFGPSASRPVIRGLGGERVRVLQNGVGVLDASGASEDHAVAVDPLAIDKIELVRGPAALLYGSQAVGGVVNLTTSRVPERRPLISEGRFEGQGSSTDLGRSGAFSLNAPVGASGVMHADLNARGADDYHAPNVGRVLNSQSRTNSGAVGGSYVGTNGFVGGSYAEYQSTYGTVAERFTHINLRQRRFDLAGEVKATGFVRSVRVKNSYSLYAHDEVEDGQTGTRFRNAGDEARVDVVHRAVAGVNGRFGLQLSGNIFSARGDEGFLPETKTHAGGVFVFEERAAGRWRPSFGVRLDLTEVAAARDDAFGPARRRNFTGVSVSSGVLYQLTPVDQLVFNASLTERAPNYQELFAHGPHAATHTYEVGNVDLGLEKSGAFEASWRRETTRVNVFWQEFAGFVAMSPTGLVVDDVPRFDYVGTSARLYGAEAEWRWPVPTRVPGGTLELGVKGDLVHGEDRARRRPLPRVTPIRESVALTYKGEALRAEADVRHAERQARIADFETATPAWVMVDLSLEVPVTLNRLDGAAFARVANVFNEEARNHVSLLKDAAPYAGRSVVAGVRATF